MGASGQDGSGYGNFKMRDPRKQLHIFTGELGENVTATLQGLATGLPYSALALTVAKLQRGFKGLNGKFYEPPFETRVLVEIKPKSDAFANQSALENLVNAVLKIIDRRCVVWGCSSEIYSRNP